MLWFSEEAIEAWHAPASGKPGGRRIYSDLAIETALTVRTVYRLGLRQTEGFFRSVSALLNLEIRIPDHSTLAGFVRIHAAEFGRDGNIAL